MQIEVLELLVHQLILAQALHVAPFQPDSTSTAGLVDVSTTKVQLEILKRLDIRMQPPENLAEYFERFETAANLVDMSGGSVTNAELLLDEEVKSNPTATEPDVMQKFLAIAFVECADSNRYMKLWKELRNDLAKGVDRDPTSLAKANTLLRRWPDTTSYPTRPFCSVHARD